ncbi:MAG TPA: YihY/virulence factor BrkB family protein [Geminicoccaceae bacterium]|nr:YihY/virulence factor BrkB family protein [Geminicoccaceae bacterium]
MVSSDHDRGRSAERPSEIPAPGWRDILWRVWAQIGQDNVSIIAAGVAFYAILAVFPAITAFVSLFGLFADPAAVQEQFANLEGMIPAEAWTLLNDQLSAVLSAEAQSLGIGALVGLLIAFYSAGAGVRALMTALNIAYNEEEKRSFVRFYLIAFLFTIGIAVLGVLSIGIIVAAPVVVNLVELGPLAGAVIKIAPWVALGAVVTVSLGALYRYGASRAGPKTRWVSWGALVATLLWIGASLLFSVYVANFGSYNQTYGALAAVVVLLMWLWISAYIVLLGAEFNAEMEHQTERDTTTGAPRPLGERGAYVADHVGEVP